MPKTKELEKSDLRLPTREEAYQNRKPGHEVPMAVDTIPDCNTTKFSHRKPTRAAYDAADPTTGTWMYMCEECFVNLRAKTGVGLGQKFVLYKPSE